MKLQADAGQLRLRLTEAELASLTVQESLVQAFACPDGSIAHCRLSLLPVAHCEGNLMDLRVALPRGAFLAFAAERPRRDGFRLDRGPFVVTVEVDVRDSHRLRRAGPPPAQTGSS